MQEKIIMFIFWFSIAVIALLLFMGGFWTNEIYFS